jgi:membrane associated rhomboid family serine protease
MAQSAQSNPESLNAIKPYLTWVLLALNIGLFFVFSMPEFPRLVFAQMMLWPTQEEFRWWQPITHCFMHNGMSHLAFNMIALWQFGSELERFIGTKRYARLYFSAVACAAILQILTNQLSENFAPMLGASGGVFGLLYGYAACFPNARIIPLIPPIPMPAWLAVSLYGAAELYFGFSGNLSTIAHFAHLGGIVGGFFALPWPWRRQDFVKMAAARGLRYRD